MFWILFKMVAVLIIDLALAETTLIYCKTYYAPCTCAITYQWGYMINCTNISTINIESVLSKPPSKVDNQIYAPYLSPNNSNIVGKSTGNRTFSGLFLDCTRAVPNKLLAVNSSAFASTKMVTSYLEIDNCDLLNLN